MALVREEQIAAMREAGLSDGEILEVNQVTSYFACANRTVLALGVTTQRGLLGLSPTDTSVADNWRHS
jgi:alkylhydroperoxidase family enzyme